MIIYQEVNCNESSAHLGEQQFVSIMR